ncbi:MAG: hypothetical protein MI724_02690 [Spirochaetales bacterium]|nr:hypothetical protein [Spirochaetales bacterium]
MGAKRFFGTIFSVLLTVTVAEAAIALLFAGNLVLVAVAGTGTPAVSTVRSSGIRRSSGSSSCRSRSPF